MGHSVTETDGVEPALEILSNTPEVELPELIICDYVMPGRNGLDLLEARPNTNTPFVLLTGEVNQDELADERVQGVTAYLTKPVASTELQSVVENLVGDLDPQSATLPG